MGMARRSKYEIYASILRVCDKTEGANITKIVYTCNLNFRSAQYHIEFLVEMDLLEDVSRSRKSYRTTSKGKQFYKKFEEMDELLL